MDKCTRCDKEVRLVFQQQGYPDKAYCSAYCIEIAREELRKLRRVERLNELVRRDAEEHDLNEDEKKELDEAETYVDSDGYTHWREV